MKKALIISCFDWYKSRLEPIRELLIHNGYEVVVLESDFDHINKKTISTRHPECTYISVPKYKKNLSIQRIKSHLCFSKKVKQFISEYKPDIIHIQIPPNYTAKYCAEYKKEHNETKLVLDIVDLWPESMPLGKLKNTFLAKKWKNLRDNCIKVADHVFTECDLYQDELKHVINPSITSTLPLYKDQNEFDRSKIDEIINNNIFQGTIKFAYLGSMNNIIDIAGICNVITKCLEAGYTCELHAIGDGENKTNFELAVKQTGCRTFFYGPIYDESEKIRILVPCDFAFNMMISNISVGLTIKSIDYLSYGIPLINNIKGDTWKFVEEDEVGINIDKLQFPLPSFDHRKSVEIYRNRYSREAFITTLSEVQL